MLKVRWLVLVFTVVFLATLIAGIPASLVMSRVPSVPLAGAPLIVGPATGTIWNGAAPVTWRQQRARLDWRVDFHGLMPGVSWGLSGDLALNGWAGARPGAVRLAVEQGRIPAGLIQHVSPFEAEGSLSISDLRLAVSDHRLVEAGGELRYSGGQAGWQQGETTLPELVARIEPDPEGALVKVTDPTGTVMMEGRVQGNRGQVQVYRAWPALLGVSRGGTPTDVVFESSQPLWNEE